MIPLSPPARVGRGRGSVLGGARGASVGAGGIGNIRLVALGFANCMSSSSTGGAMVVVVVVAGVMWDATVVGWPVGACVCATVKLKEGVAEGSVGLAVIFGGPRKKI